MSVIAFIPVRGGSKSIKLKNIKNFCGRPLVYWTAKAANDAVKVDKVIIATDSETINHVVQEFNLPKAAVYERDAANAQDSSSTESVMLEYIERAGLSDSDIFILIQATSPLTTKHDIDTAFNLYINEQADSLLSCSCTKRFFWDAAGRSLNYDFRNRPRRQDFAGTLMENGAIYISSVKAIRASRCRLSGKIAVYEMPEYCGVEIDEPSDWLIAENLMKENILKNAVHRVKLFMTDVDGVLTDGGMYYSESGDEMKRFNTLDGKGIELLRNAGITTAILTSENTKIVEARAKKLKIDFVCQGCMNKLAAAEELCKSLRITLDEAAYIGDDLNDAELLSHVGLAACPANAVDAVKDIYGIRKLKRSGGDGAVREFCEYILSELKQDD
ncbi:MAG: acylneuraminate cytidylyltransferase [Synergistaceae bacterium]|nr:acylneuraminate cytidylyltransferase [Synergistaceae bacterium]